MATHEIPALFSDYAAAIGPDQDEVLAEMDEKARREGFPHVGPAVGGWLAMCARLTDATRVFEFGSGFGYSAYWFARELPTQGEVVLTEIDDDELDEAETFLTRGGLGPRVRLEHGDAIEIVDEYDGPFDVVLIDCEKDRYAEAFEAVREKVTPGGIVVADNTVSGAAVDAAALLEHFRSGEADEGEPVEMNRNTHGIADYLEQVRAAADFETALLPVGQGITVSHRDVR